MRKNTKAIAISKARSHASRFGLLLSATLLAFFIAWLALMSQAKAGIFGVFPQCNSVVVEKWIIKRFNEAEEKQWKRGYTLSKVAGMHEHRTGQWKDSDIVRRYCNGTAYFSNGSKRQVYYLLEDIGGFVGKNWGLTYCVSGLDPWNNHDANCRTLR